MERYLFHWTLTISHISVRLNKSIKFLPNQIKISGSVHEWKKRKRGATLRRARHAGRHLTILSLHDAAEIEATVSTE